jgi:hypothetical protein
MIPSLGLTEVAELLKNEDALDDPRIIEFVQNIQQAGRSILESKTDEYILCAVALNQSIILSSLIAGLIKCDPQLLHGLLNIVCTDEFAQIMALSLKMTIGLGVLEEWH